MKRGKGLARRTPLRADPEKTKAWQQRSRKRLERTTELAAVNTERKAALYERNYGEKADWIRTESCYVTRHPANPDPDQNEIVAAHTRHSKGAGGKSEDLVPFHCLVEIDWHQMPEAVFEAKYGHSKQACKDAAERYEFRWQEMVEGRPDPGM